MQTRGIAAALLVSLAGAGFSAQALAPQGPGAADEAPAPTGYEAEDHFPGAAYFTAIDDSGTVSAAGTTGTNDLPDLPIPAGPADDGTVIAAAPFPRAGSATDRSRALQCLTDAIYYEAANEPDAGQRAVAQVVLNRVRHPAFPATVCGVVFQGSEKPGCQFSFACDGSMARGRARAAWDRAERVAKSALDGSVFAPVGLATHYHTHAVTPSWNRKLVMTGVFGAHFFHRWQGGWGTSAAFHQRYLGGEPVPGPKRAAPATEPAASAAPAPVPSPDPVRSAAQTPRENIRSRYAESGTPRDIARAAARPAEAPGLPESTILDRWKGTGQPIR
ncbi:cell wall hydrolase [Sphingosinithalassobacter tenebrarum]|uniref:Cell wall hydrolase n=2 Tax=Stakelama tenebrarum TaxID=2711215 RepID=A0A6G6YAZ6_9SPHN|nr:cell wall hydrolase [Sphingosinithalassobacter tenebrarum]